MPSEPSRAQASIAARRRGHTKQTPEAAHVLQDLAALPGNRFEALKGERKGQYSIRINLQWRICFEWPDKSSGPTNVEIADYR